MSSIKHSYVYKLQDKRTGKFYIGYRTCLKSRLPDEDLGTFYFTSGSFKVDFKTNPSNFTKEILGTFDLKLDAYDHEQYLIEQNFNNKLCVNKCLKKTTGTSRVSVPFEFEQSIVNLSQSKRRKARLKEKKRLASVKKYEKAKKNFKTYFDEELQATVTIIP